MKNKMVMTMIGTSNKLIDSSIGQGLVRLLNDALGAVMLLGPIVCLIFAAIFVAQAGIADETESPAKRKKAKYAVACAVICLLVPSIVKLLMNYFGVSVEV